MSEDLIADEPSEAHEYCVVHDRPLDWCPDQDKCREIMKSWGLYPDGADRPVCPKCGTSGCLEDRALGF